MTFTLDCAGGDCPLLEGMPQTSGMRGGSVMLKPGDSVGWHSTAANDEALVILHGSGIAQIEGHSDVPPSGKDARLHPACDAAQRYEQRSRNTGVCLGSLAGIEWSKIGRK
jgi:hypothetical protein